MCTYKGTKHAGPEESTNRIGKVYTGRVSTERPIWDMETDKVLGVDSIFVSLSVVTREGCIRDLVKETVGTLGKGEAINNKS